MAQYEQKDGAGALFKNDRKEKPNHPDVKGSVTLGGKDFWISGWNKESKSGAKYVSIQLTPKDEAAQPKKERAALEHADPDVLPF